MLFDYFNWCIGLRVSVLLGIKGEGEIVVEARQTVDRETEGDKQRQVTKAEEFSSLFWQNVQLFGFILSFFC